MKVVAIKESTLPEGVHKCSVYCGTQDCICNLDLQEKYDLGNCMVDKHYYKEVKDGKSA